MKLKTKEVILLGILAAILVISQVALSFLPNVELVSLLIILYTLIYGRKTQYIIFVFVTLMGLIYGFGTWIMGYYLIWPSLSLLTHVLRKYLEGNYLRLALYSGAFGFAFGALYALPYLVIASPSFALTYWLNGIPYDVIHMIGNYFTMILLGGITYKLISKLNKIYSMNP